MEQQTDISSYKEVMILNGNKENFLKNTRCLSKIYKAQLF